MREIRSVKGAPGFLVLGTLYESLDDAWGIAGKLAKKQAGRRILVICEDQLQCGYVVFYSGEKTTFEEWEKHWYRFALPEHCAAFIHHHERFGLPLEGRDELQEAKLKHAISALSEDMFHAGVSGSNHQR